jgi:hypothetical protein
MATTTYTSEDFAALTEIRDVISMVDTLKHLPKQQKVELGEYIGKLAPNLTIPTLDGVVGNVEYSISSYDGRQWRECEEGEDDEVLDGTFAGNLMELVEYFWEKTELPDELDDWKLTITTN